MDEIKTETEVIVLESFIEISSLTRNHLVNYGDFKGLNTVRFEFDAETLELVRIEIIKKETNE